MLIRITNQCSANCKHCFIEGAGPDGAHMSLDTFEAALRFARSLREPILLLAGGEPTNHPELPLLVQLARRAATITFVASNGLFALDERRRQEVFALCGMREHGRRRSAVVLQVTCDPRYYKRNLGLVRHIFAEPFVEFVDTVDRIQQCQRSNAAKIAPTKLKPSCFNLRAGTRQTGSMPAAIALVRQQITTHVPCCTPSVDPDGTIRAGETDTCATIGTVFDPLDRVETRVLAVECDSCGTMRNVEEEKRHWAFPERRSAS